MHAAARTSRETAENMPEGRRCDFGTVDGKAWKGRISRDLTSISFNSAALPGLPSALRPGREIASHPHRDSTNASSLRVLILVDFLFPAPCSKSACPRLRRASHLTVRYVRFQPSADVSGQVSVKSSVQRSIRASILAQWKINPETFEQIWPKKEPITLVKWSVLPRSDRPKAVVLTDAPPSSFSHAAENTSPSTPCTASPSSSSTSTGPSSPHSGSCTNVRVFCLPKPSHRHPASHSN